MSSSLAERVEAGRDDLRLVWLVCFGLALFLLRVGSSSSESSGTTKSSGYVSDHIIRQGCKLLTLVNLFDLIFFRIIVFTSFSSLSPLNQSSLRLRLRYEGIVVIHIVVFRLCIIDGFTNLNEEVSGEKAPRKV